MEVVKNYRGAVDVRDEIDKALIPKDVSGRAGTARKGAYKYPQ